MILRKDNYESKNKGMLNYFNNLPSRFIADGSLTIGEIMSNKSLAQIKEEAKQGISVGYHPSNTLDNALEKAMDNFYKLLQKQNFIIPKDEANQKEPINDEVK